MSPYGEGDYGLYFVSTTAGVYQTVAMREC